MLLTKAFFVIRLSIFILAAVPFAPAYSQGTIAIVDIPKILKGSSAANGLRDTLEAVHEKLNARRVQVEKDLRSEDVDLSRQRSLLAPEAFSKKQKQFQDKVANLQQELQEEQRKVEEGLSVIYAPDRNSCDGDCQCNNRRERNSSCFPKRCSYLRDRWLRYF